MVSEVTTNSAVDTKLAEAVTALITARDAVKAKFIERDEIIDYAALSIVAASNMLVIGPPGTAKSAVFGDLLARLEGSKGFFALTKGSTPETLVGPMSLSAMKKQERFKYNTKGMLPDVRYAFIDEVFKGNSLTRNAALQVLNERRFFNGGDVEECPLQFCGSASNEFPDAREDGAFYDRFLSRFMVFPISSDAARQRMVNISLSRGRQFGKGQEDVSIAHVDVLQNARSAVTVPDHVVDAANNLYHAVITVQPDGIGDRRWAESFALAQARAVVHGRDTMEVDDLIVFKHTAWHEESTRKDVQAAVIQAVQPKLTEIEQLFEEIQEGYDRFLIIKKEADERDDYMHMLEGFRTFNTLSAHNFTEIESAVQQLAAEGRDVSKGQELFLKAKGMMDDAMNTAFRT